MKNLPVLFLLLLTFAACEKQFVEPTAKTNDDCDTTVSYQIIQSRIENLIVFRNGVLDTAFYPSFNKSGFIQATLDYDCADTIKVYRGRVFDPITKPFEYLFDGYQLQDTIRTVQDKDIYGFGCWTVLKFEVNSEAINSVTIEFKSLYSGFKFQFDVIPGNHLYTFVIDIDHPYYRHVELYSTGAAELKGIRLKGFYLHGELSEFIL